MELPYRVSSVLGKGPWRYRLENYFGESVGNGAGLKEEDLHLAGHTAEDLPRAWGSRS